MRVKLSNRLRLFLLLSLLFLSTHHAQAQSSTAPRVWEESLSIPTYELGPPNPYPALLDWQRRRWRPVYPYPFLDNLSNTKTNKNWKAVYLENEYLRVCVLPELGGHIYQIFDKTTNRDVLYSNPVMIISIKTISLFITRATWPPKAAPTIPIRRVPTT